MVLAGPGADSCAELASADGSSNLCRGPVMRVERVLGVGAVAMRGALMLPEAFEDVEDGRLRARHLRRGLPSSSGLPSSGAVCQLCAASDRRVRPRPARRLCAGHEGCACPERSARSQRTCQSKADVQGRKAWV